jgi:predicted ATPase
LTPLVGRQAELHLLQKQYSKAKRGKGQVVMISGEPGSANLDLLLRYELD